MTTQVTISLSDELYQGVANFAQLLGKDIREVLSETIALSLASITCSTPKSISTSILPTFRSSGSFDSPAFFD